MSKVQTNESKSGFIPWWLVLLNGILAILLGLLLIFRPGATLLILVQFLGVYWLISGVITILSLLWDRTAWGWKLFSGVLGIIAGVLIVQNPLWSTLLVPASLAIVIGILGIVIGIIGLIQAFRGGGWGAGILGLMSILLGLVLVFNPVVAAAAMSWMLGALLIGGGFLAIFMAFGLRKAEKHPEPQPVPTVARVAPVEIPVVPAAAAVAAAEAVKAEAPIEPVAEMPEEAAVVETPVPLPVAPAALAAVAAAQVVEELAPPVEPAAEAPVEAAAEDAVEVLAPPAETVAETPAESAFVDELAAEVPVPVALAAAAVAAIAAEGAVEELAAPAEPVVLPEEDRMAETSAAVLTGNVDLGDLEEAAKFKHLLEYVEGVGPVYAEKLKAIGLVTCLDLLRYGATRKGREEIVEKSEISARLVLKWVNHVDLYRIKGVGSEYADLLKASGVDTVVELAQRNPANLFARITELNIEKEKVRKLPTESQVEDWVAQAKDLPRVVSY